MRCLMPLIWSLVIATLISYVITSMAGEEFQFIYPAIIAPFFYIAVLILGDDILNEHQK